MIKSNIADIPLDPPPSDRHWAVWPRSTRPGCPRSPNPGQGQRGPAAGAACLMVNIFVCSAWDQHFHWRRLTQTAARSQEPGPAPGARSQEPGPAPGARSKESGPAPANGAIPMDVIIPLQTILTPYLVEWLQSSVTQSACWDLFIIKMEMMWPDASRHGNDAVLLTRLRQGVTQSSSLVLYVCGLSRYKHL